jgi:hypothetical protein
MRKLLSLIIFTLVIYAGVLGRKTNNPDAQFTLPSLFNVKNPLEYLGMLRDFQVIDFQPVRDLSFFIDLTVFRLTDVVTFATFNVLLWGLGCFLLLKLFERIVPVERRSGAIFWILAFASYPLFSQAVPWGMARKHILAFPIFLACTHAWLDWLEGKTKWLKVYVLYVAATLTHPLTLLWPAWAAFHFHIKGHEKSKESRKLFLIFSLTAITLFFTHYAYYTVGNSTVKDVFPQVSPDVTNFLRIIQNLCFYLRQLIFPYELGFLYYPTWENSWPGILFFVLLSVFFYRERKDRETLSWLVFSLTPVPVFLALPGVFDQYLIIPAAGLTLIAFRKWNHHSKAQVSFFVVLTLIWSVVTFRESSLWANPRELTGRNFRNGPSCRSALNYALQIYTEGKKAPSDLLQFLQKGKCLETSPGDPEISKRGVRHIEALMLFYEGDKFPREFRMSRLEELGASHYYPHLILAAILATEDRAPEVEQRAEFVLWKTAGAALDTGPVIDDVLRPYCQKNNLEACLKVTIPQGLPGYL